MAKTKLGFVGAGKVGTALAVRLSQAGYPVAAIFDIKPEAAQNFANVVKGCKVVGSKQEVAAAADMVFLSTTDDQIRITASEVKWRPGQMVVHCSGAQTTALLESAKKQGAIVGVFHPGQVFTDKEQAIKNIAGATFDVEAEGILLEKFKEMAKDLGGTIIEVKAIDRPVFHVAEELCALFVLVDYKVAIKMMKAINIDEEQAKLVLLPLMRATLKNIETFGTRQQNPGPVDRGDVETVKRHLDGMKRVAPFAIDLYRNEALSEVPQAVEWGSITKEKGEELIKTIKTYLA